ncbi:hypothetical protein AAG596_12795, partial [Citromicrobium bathyomarinum]|uniref:hypothetical protein n=1 Tax=Citromicrobium bathyomarinum TaxID=72174 RepID=UPI00315A1A2F
LGSRKDRNAGFKIVRRKGSQMSIINAWRNGKTGYLFTDTAYVDRFSGNVICFAGKSFYAAHWPAVIGVTMAGGVTDYVAEPFMTSPPKNLRALTRLMPEACEHFLERAKAENSHEAYVRLIAVAWCARTRSVRIYHCSTLDEFGGPLVARELDFYLGSGAGAPEVIASQERLQARKAVSPDTEAIELLEAQRRAPFEAEGPMACTHAIGGQVVRLTVTRRGVREDIIHDWPDVEGEPIAV